MGIEADDQDQQHNVDDPQNAGNDQDIDTGAGKDEGGKPDGDGKGKPGEADDGEVEVVLTGDSPTPDDGKGKPGLGRRQRKLLERNDRLKQELSQADQAKEALAAENRLLRMQMQQRQQQEGKQPDKAPTLAECGYDEDVFAQKMQDYLSGTSRSALSDELKKYEQRQLQQQFERNRASALEAHYERADKLKVPDYDVAEEKAVEALGRDFVADVAARLPDSEVVLYFLGKNPGKAREIAELAKRDPALAAVAIGELKAGLKVQPKGAKTNTPEPDTPAGGGGASTSSAWQRKLDKAVEHANRTGNMDEVSRIRREAAKAGVKLT